MPCAYSLNLINVSKATCAWTFGWRAQRSSLDDSNRDDVMLPRILISASAAIVLVLGLVHLRYTFHGPKLHPRDPALATHMQRVAPVISRETTMWKAWIGFNASHSYGAILYGTVYGYLALDEPAFLFHSPFLCILGLAFLLGYVVLGKLYWFSVPFRGVVLATVCYVSGFVLRLI
jgi:hypothetical protein